MVTNIQAYIFLVNLIQRDLSRRKVLRELKQKLSYARSHHIWQPYLQSKASNSKNTPQPLCDFSLTVKKDFVFSSACDVLDEMKFQFSGTLLFMRVIRISNTAIVRNLIRSEDY